MMNRNARRVSAVEIPSSSPPRRRRPSTTDAGPSGSRKRRRLTNQTVSSSGSQAENEHGNEAVESIDLTDVDGNSAIAKVLAKQREDAIASQHLNDGGGVRSKLAAYKCPICMDSPVDATTTVCGHMFCHKCIIDTLKFSEEQRADHAGKTPRGTCPVCRKPLARADAPGPKRNLVPLEIKLTTKKKSRTGGEGET